MHSIAGLRILAAGLVTAACVAPILPAQTIEGKFYEYKVMSTTGQTPANANQPLSGMSPPSINQNGVVAFSATFNGGGEGVVAASPTLAQSLISFANPASGRIFSVSAQINNANQVLASDAISGASFDRLWYVAKPGANQVLVRGGPGQPYFAVSGNGSVNSSGAAAIPALDAAGNTLILSVNAGAVVGQLTLPANSFPFPQITDAGNILVRFGQQPNSPIYIYNQTLTAPIVDVADGTCFNVIGNQPGISADGLIVVFYGEPNPAPTPCITSIDPTPGIFAYVNNGTSGTYVRLTGIPGELGYDDNYNPVSFASYSNDSRVAVVNLGTAPIAPCPAGPAIAGNSFVVSFIGTPSGPSRTNPVMKGAPLLFSGQQGLWTIRADAQCQLSSPSTMVFHPRTAIPAVQIGDNFLGNVISSIGVFNQLANAAEDDTGAIRTMRRGDHRVAFWAQTTTGQQMIVRGSHLDSDQDGLLDHWETSGIDMDQNGSIDLNIALMGAKPNARDLFLQIDWLGDGTSSSRFQPLPGVISPAPGQLVTPLEFMFTNAPALAGNSYGVRSDGHAPADIPTGITLHMDGGSGKDINGGSFNLNMGTGQLAGGNQVIVNGVTPDVLYFGPPNSIAVPNVNTLAFQTAKDNFFGQFDMDGRELAFHYAIFADYLDLFENGGSGFKVSAATANTLTSPSSSPFPSGPNGIIETDVVKIVSGTGPGQYRSIKSIDFNTNTLTVSQPWQTQPDTSSIFVIFKNTRGKGEVFFYENPEADQNSLPGNDLMIGVGAMGAFGWTEKNVLGDQCNEWRILAHELGHNLGLRHGGTDQTKNKGSNYLSLMNYEWTDACNSTVTSYSGAGDLTFDDWANLQFDLTDAAIHLGNTLRLGFNSVPEESQAAPEPNVLDFLTANGPPSTVPPVIKIQTPAANGNVGLTLPLGVSATVTDAAPISSVTVAFDVNGDGNTTDPGENVLAKLNGTNTYSAGFSALSGPTGLRTITVSAIDNYGNYASVTEAVNVVQPNPAPSLTSLKPNSDTHGGPKFQLSIAGSNFVSGAVAQWNGANRATTFVNSGEVIATILATDIAAAGTANVTVKNPSPGGGTSNTLTFTIH